MGNSAIFLDRDGTLNENTGYLIQFEDFRPIKGVEEALALLQRKGYRLFVVSNQSGVARGFFTLHQVMELNLKIRDWFGKRQIVFEDMIVCPHHPEGQVKVYQRDCACRKPRPGMLFQLARRYQLDLGRSFMVGDRMIDAEAGMAAGSTGVLIRKKDPANSIDMRTHFREFDSLLEFARTLEPAA